MPGSHFATSHGQTRLWQIGDRVIVDTPSDGRGERLAEIRYIGRVPEIAPGYWIGVEVARRDEDLQIQESLRKLRAQISNWQ